MYVALPLSSRVSRMHDCRAWTKVFMLVVLGEDGWQCMHWTRCGARENPVFSSLEPSLCTYGGCRWCHPCITRHGVHSMRDTWRGLVERQESDEVGWLHSDSLPVACHTLGAGGKGQHPRTSNPGGCVGQGANQNVHGVVWVTKIRFTTDDDSRVPKDGNKVCEEDVVNRRDESKVDDLRRDPEQPVDVHRLDKVLVHVLFPLCL